MRVYVVASQLIGSLIGVLGTSTMLAPSFSNRWWWLTTVSYALSLAMLALAWAIVLIVRTVRAGGVA